MLVVCLGGVRSGKSRFAVELARRQQAERGDDVVFIATSPRIDGDAELDARIERHRSERPSGWATIEAEHDLAEAIDAAGTALVILDCVTVWVANLLWRGDSEAGVHDAARRAVEAATARRADTIVVTNEVGSGVHPSTDLGRHFRDLLGEVNQRWVRAADRALLFSAGRAVELTDPWSLWRRER